MLDRGQGFFGFASSYQDPELKVYEDPYNLKPGWPALEEDFTIDLDLNSELHTDGKHYSYQPFRMLAMMLGCAGDEVFNPTFDWEALNRANNHWEIGRLLTTNDPNRGIRRDYNAYESSFYFYGNIRGTRVFVSPISHYAHELSEYYYSTNGASLRPKKINNITFLKECIAANKLQLDSNGKVIFSGSYFDSLPETRKNNIMVKPDDLINIPGRVYQYLNEFDTANLTFSNAEKRSFVERDILYDLIGKFISDIKNDFVYTLIEYQEQGSTINKNKRVLTPHQVLSSTKPFRYRLRITMKPANQRTGPSLSKFVPNVNFKNTIVNEWYIHSIKEKFEFAIFNNLQVKKCGFFGRLPATDYDRFKEVEKNLKNVYMIMTEAYARVKHRHVIGKINSLDRDGLVIYNTIQGTREFPVFVFDNKPIIIVYWALDMAYRKKNKENFELLHNSSSRTESFYGSLLFNFMYDWNYSDTSSINVKVRELQKLKYKSNLRYFEILVKELSLLHAIPTYNVNTIKGILACVTGAESSYDFYSFLGLGTYNLGYTHTDFQYGGFTNKKRNYYVFLPNNRYMRFDNKDLDSYVYNERDLVFNRHNDTSIHAMEKWRMIDPYSSMVPIVKPSCYEHFSNCQAYTYLEEFELDLPLLPFCLLGFRAIAPIKIKLKQNDYIENVPETDKGEHYRYIGALAYADYYHEGFEGMFKVVVDRPIRIQNPDAMFAGCRVNDAVNLFDFSSATRLICTYFDFQLGAAVGTKTNKGRDAFVSIKKPNTRSEVEILISPEIHSALFTFAHSDTVSQTTPLKLKIKSGDIRSSGKDAMDLFVINGMFFKTNFPNNTVLMENLNNVNNTFFAFYEANTGTGHMKGLDNINFDGTNAFYAPFQYTLANIRDEPTTDIIKNLTFGMKFYYNSNFLETTKEKEYLGRFLLGLPRNIRANNFITFDPEWIKFSKFSDFDKKFLNSYIYGTI